MNNLGDIERKPVVPRAGCLSRRTLFGAKARGTRQRLCSRATMRVDVSCRLLFSNNKFMRTSTVHTNSALCSCTCGTKGTCSMIHSYYTTHMHMRATTRNNITHLQDNGTSRLLHLDTVQPSATGKDFAAPIRTGILRTLPPQRWEMSRVSRRPRKPCSGMAMPTH